MARRLQPGAAAGAIGQSGREKEAANRGSLRCNAMPVQLSPELICDTAANGVFGDLMALGEA